MEPTKESSTVAVAQDSRNQISVFTGHFLMVHGSVAQVRLTDQSVTV